MKGRVVRVHWDDSAGPYEGHWHDGDVDLGIVHCVSVGFLWRETEDAVLLAMGHDDNEEPRVHHIWAIPRRAITEMVDIGFDTDLMDKEP